MSSTATTQPAPKVSWLKHVGQVFGKVLRFLAGEAAPIADQAAKVAEIFLPQFAPEIQFADNLVTRIAKQAVVTESLAATATGTTGAQKLEQVVGNIGPELDAWVQNNFPGATAVSKDVKAGLVNAVVALLNELQEYNLLAPAPSAGGSAPAPVQTSAPAAAAPAAAGWKPVPATNATAEVNQG